MTWTIKLRRGRVVSSWFIAHWTGLLTFTLSVISIWFYYYYLNSGLGLNYNDARSHLDIGRRVVEGLKPGLAQLGSVWLPLNHLLMIPLIWNDWMWHSGFAGAVWNMLSFVGTGLVIDRYLADLKVGRVGRVVGVAVFVANLNILYLQSTAMTEILLLFTMTVGARELSRWLARGETIALIKAGFWIMLATLTRYDGWFLLGVAGLLVAARTFYSSRFLSFRERHSRMEGTTILFATLASVGILAWFAWNQLIFKDALYFMLGPFSAHAQQEVMAASGALPTKFDLLLSIKVYLYAAFYSSYTYPFLLGLAGFVGLWRDKKLAVSAKLGSLALVAPLVFNILSLYLGFSVIYVQGISGDTWFNIRYGVMLVPTIAVLVGLLVDRLPALRSLLIGSIAFVLFFAFVNGDAVALDDALVGSSQKNVSEVSSYLTRSASDKPGYILISAASHDAIIFSSGLPMKRFIHEGTGKYWENALSYPDRWARWIVMRTYDQADLVWDAVSRSDGFSYYHKVSSYPFADIYELDEEYLPLLNTDIIIRDNK